jgi:predicted PurR-regulated permease PerM
MEITLIIVGGLVLMTVFASGFDYLTKRSKRMDNKIKAKVFELEQKMTNLEQLLAEKSDRIVRLENDCSFLNKLLEMK